jgi:hypothetical protein
MNLSELINSKSSNGYDYANKYNVRVEYIFSIIKISLYITIERFQAINILLSIILKSVYLLICSIYIKFNIII